MDPSRTVGVGDTPTIIATISPRSVDGTVEFRVEDSVVARQVLHSGIASISLPALMPGTHVVGARFIALGAHEASAEARPLNLVVGTGPQIALTSFAGKDVSAGADSLHVGESVRLAVSGFPPLTQVHFALGTVEIVQSIWTDGSGRGALSIKVPPVPGGSTFLVVGRGGSNNASAVVTADYVGAGTSVPQSDGTVPIQVTVPPSTAAASLVAASSTFPLPWAMAAAIAGTCVAMLVPGWRTRLRLPLMGRTRTWVPSRGTKGRNTRDE